MKQSKLNLSIASALLLFPLVLTSCGEGGSTNTSYEPGKEDINAIIANFEKGFTMKGEVKQKRTVLDVNDPNNIQTEEQTYRVEALFENSDRQGTSVTHYGKLGELETIIDQTFAYADDKGYAYKEYLDYKNEIQRQYLYDYGNKLSFAAAGLYNFMGIFNASDFTYDGHLNCYNVNVDKVGVVLKNLLGHINTGFFYKPSKAVMTIKNNVFDTFNVVIEEFKQVVAQENTLVKTIYNNEVAFTFTEVGTTKLPRVKSYDAKPENAELTKALSAIGDNYTLDIENALSIDNGLINKKYKMYKYDGEQILMQTYREIIERDMLTPTNHFILKRLGGSQNDLLFCHTMQQDEKTYAKSAHRLFAKNYQGVYYYEDLLPTPSIISTDFFTYDENFNEYISNDSAVVDQLKPLLTINKAPLADEHALNAHKLGIRLDDDGNLDYIKFYINYRDLFNDSKIEGSIKASFTDVGSTTI